MPKYILTRLTCILAASCLAEFTRLASADRPLRIVTFNAQVLAAPRTRDSMISRFRFDAARQRHFEKVASVIETLEPDILNLVEVTSAAGVQLLVDILHEKGMDDYRGYHVDSKDSFSGFDVALISRMEPDNVDGMPIRIIHSDGDDLTWVEPYSFRDKQGVLHDRKTSLNRNSIYYFTIDGVKLGFFGLHLKSNPSDARANGRRTAESNLVQRAVLREIVSRDYLPIVLGDLNDYDPDVPDRDEHRSTKTRVLASIKNYDAESAGPELFNVAQRIQRQQDRYTSHWDVNENGAQDPEDVRTMIDFILVHQQIVPWVQRVFISHDIDLDVSDHFPLVVDLVVPEG